MVRVLFGVTAALALLLTLGNPAQAGDKKKKAAAEDVASTITGTITGVSDDGRTLTIQPAPADGKKAKKKNAAPAVEIKLTDKTKTEWVGIEKDGLKFKAGQAVTVTLVDGSKDTAAAVKVSQPAEQPKKKKKKDPK
jgi:hypothetical protein